MRLDAEAKTTKTNLIFVSDVTSMVHFAFGQRILCPTRTLWQHMTTVLDMYYPAMAGSLSFAG